MDETKTETSTHHGGRIQPRRSSRSTISASPTTAKEDRNGSLPESTTSPTSPSSASITNDTPLNGTGTPAATTAAPANLTANHHSRVTRSLSADSNSNEDSPNSSTTPTNVTTSTSTTSANTNTLNQNGKRRRHTNNSKSSNKKKSGTTATTTTTSPSTTNTSVSPSSTTSGVKSPPPRGAAGADDYERETRNTTQRLSKEAKDARKAEREIIVKKKLGELEILEQKVKDQSHEEYQKLLEEIQSKRTKKLNVAKGRHTLMEANFKNGFLAQKKSAFDKFHLDKLALRRKMMNQVQQQINRIEQEYFSSQQSTKSSLDEQNLIDWAPPDRPSMINILFYLYNNDDDDDDDD
ncbi:hypothetical protein BCR42DRAFT_424635, partial [Absidia repens]